jgi:Succinylglutamate desuccinylase / Aspartoacylase family
VLTTLTELPPGLLSTSPVNLHRVLPGPTLIHLPGRREPPLFVSVLLHGNEHSGLEAIQAILARDRGKQLPRALSIFIGNVAAAARGLRHLDGQPDYNRVWPGADSVESSEQAMMREVVRQMRARGVYASIDIHNNTGLNPHYGCVSRLERRTLHLASLFSRIVVFFRRPLGVQSMAFAELCPAVTLECGKSGERGGAEHAADLIDAVLRLDHFPQQPVPPHDLDLYHTVGIVKVPEAVSFGFARGQVDVAFDRELDHMNFRELDRGTRIARVRAGCMQPVEVFDESGSVVTGRYFEVIDGELRTRLRLLPAMLTLDERVIRQDCLCYLMERYPVPSN